MSRRKKEIFRWIGEKFDYFCRRLRDVENGQREFGMSRVVFREEKVSIVGRELFGEGGGRGKRDQARCTLKLTEVEGADRIRVRDVE